ncbi:hypothetical protein I3843_04G140900 [Carya illinoinensis]|nr:hypothetical protein I3843_04G140900 [Carya illinoinensis]
MQPACSNATSADSMISSKAEPILRLTTMQAHSSLLFSGLTGESSARDDQDFFFLFRLMLFLVIAYMYVLII